MQTRAMERSTSMVREKRALDPIASEEGQRETKRPALAGSLRNFIARAAVVHPEEGEKWPFNFGPYLSVIVIVEALTVDSLQKFCSSLEPILRRVVSEEVERALAKLGPAKLQPRSSPRRIEGHDSKILQLHFQTRLAFPLFTGGKLEGEQGAAIQILLLDANTGRVVSGGPESSVKVDVVVLEGDFDNEDEKGWSQEEFESHIVKEREGKRPLLTGELQVILKEGVGTLGDLSFTDNSSWIRSRKFRLGLKVAPGCCDGMRIREAKTDAFTVKDHRGELYKKHYPPALNDEVWRLEKIGKDGSFHKKLKKAGIFTVEDFLRLVMRDCQRLRNILGSGMSNKMWDVLVEHAKTCVQSGKLYVYYADDASNVGVVFNNIYEFGGILAGGQYHPGDSLSDSQKVYVDTLVKKAYENWMHVIEYDCKSLLSFQHEETSTESQSDIAVAPQNYSNSFDHPQLTLPTLPETLPSEQSSMNAVGGHSLSMGTRYAMQSQSTNLSTPIQSDGASFPLSNPISSATQQALPSRFENLRGLAPPQPSTLGFQGGSTSSFSTYKGIGDFFTEEEIQIRSHQMLENEDMQHLLRTCNMGPHGQSSVNGLDDGYPYSATPFAPHRSSSYGFDDDRACSSGKAVAGWLKLKAALRWGIFVRKKAAERRAQLVELDDM